MASSNNGNWSAFSGSGSSRYRGGGAAAGGGGSQYRPGGAPRREFPAAFQGGKPQRGQGHGEKMYTRQWYDQQRREKETAEQRMASDAEKSRELNDVNFPALVSSFAAPAVSRASGHGWHQRGSDLARAWGEAADEQKEIESMQKQMNEYRAMRSQIYERGMHDMPLPFRSSSNHYAEDAYPEEEQHQEREVVVGGAAGDEVWTTVDSSAKKARPVRRTGDWHHLTEYEEPQDDSVWGSGAGGREEDDSVW